MFGMLDVSYNNQTQTSNESTIHINVPYTPFIPPNLNAQPQRCNCCSLRPSTCRAPFLVYFSNGYAISARSSVDGSTSPADKFSKIRFAFLRHPQRGFTIGTGRSTSGGVTLGKTRRKLTRILVAPQPTRCNWATVILLRFAIAGKLSRS